MATVEWKSAIRQLRASAGTDETKSSRNSTAARRVSTVALPIASLRRRCIALELDGGHFPLARRRQFKELPWLKPHRARNHVGRERLDACVQIPHHGVVVPARVLHIAFYLRERVLK